MTYLVKTVAPHISAWLLEMPAGYVAQLLLLMFYFSFLPSEKAFAIRDPRAR